MEDESRGGSVAIKSEWDLFADVDENEQGHDKEEAAGKKKFERMRELAADDSYEIDDYEEEKEVKGGFLDFLGDDFKETNKRFKRKSNDVVKEAWNEDDILKAFSIRCLYEDGSIDVDSILSHPNTCEQLQDMVIDTESKTTIGDVFRVSKEIKDMSGALAEIGHKVPVKYLFGKMSVSEMDKIAEAMNTSSDEINFDVMLACENVFTERMKQEDGNKLDSSVVEFLYDFNSARNALAREYSGKTAEERAPFEAIINSRSDVYNKTLHEYICSNNMFGIMAGHFEDFKKDIDEKIDSSLKLQDKSELLSRLRWNLLSGAEVSEDSMRTYLGYVAKYNRDYRETPENERGYNSKNPFNELFDGASSEYNADIRTMLREMRDNGEIDNDSYCDALEKSFSTELYGGLDLTDTANELFENNRFLEVFKDYASYRANPDSAYSKEVPQVIYDAGLKKFGGFLANYDPETATDADSERLAEIFKLSERYHYKSDSEQEAILPGLLGHKLEIVTKLGHVDYLVDNYDKFGRRALDGIYECVRSFEYDSYSKTEIKMRDVLEEINSNDSEIEYSEDDKFKVGEILVRCGERDAFTSEIFTKDDSGGKFLKTQFELAQSSKETFLTESELKMAIFKNAVFDLRRNNRTDYVLSDEMADFYENILEQNAMIGIFYAAEPDEMSDFILDMIKSFDGVWDKLSPEERMDKAYDPMALFKSLCEMKTENEKDEASRLEAIHSLKDKVAYYKRYDDMIKWPQYFTEADFSELFDGAKDIRYTYARDELSDLYSRIKAVGLDMIPEGSYSEDTMNRMREIITTDNRFDKMVENVDDFSEYLGSIKDSKLSSGFVEGLAKYTGTETFDKMEEYLNPLQLQLARLASGVDRMSRASILGMLCQTAEFNNGENKAYYEVLFENFDASEMMGKITNSASGELRRFGGVAIGNAVRASIEELNVTNIEKYLKDEITFFEKPVPTYFKLLKSAIYHDISSGGNDMKKEGTAVLRQTENFAERRSIIGADLMRCSMRSNNRSLRDFLEKAASGNIETADQHYVDDVLRDASAAFGEEYNSPLEVLQAMTKYSQERDAKNRASVIENPSGSGHYVLKEAFTPSDLYKGIRRSRFYDQLFENGFNSPEMMGVCADHDVTHYDSDMSVSSAPEGSSLKTIIEESISNDYGDTQVMLRYDDRFYGTGPEDEIDLESLPNGYECYARSFYDDRFRGIRTGFGSNDIDAFSVSSVEQPDFPRLKFEIARKGCYIPIVSRETNEVIFTPSDYDEMRKRFSGLKFYGVPSYISSEEGISVETDLDKYQFGDNLEIPESVTNQIGVESYASLMNGFEAKKDETVRTQNAVLFDFASLVKNSDLPDSFKEHFEMMGSTLGDTYNTNVAMFSTGSTGRLSNVLHDGDYDFMVLLDGKDYEENSTKFIQLLQNTYGGRLIGGVDERGLRSGKFIAEGQRIDLDVSVMRKNDMVQSSTDSMLAERYRVMEAQDPEAYKAAIANVITAKALFKNAGCYKKRNSEGATVGQGGIGGIGVENWILQNGGSLYTAMESFRKASVEAMNEAKNMGYGADSTEAFRLFKVKYPIYDMGQNFMSRITYGAGGATTADERYSFDNLTEGDRVDSLENRFELGGWLKMYKVCTETLQAYA